ncbi:Hypothetical protein CINCED_3A000081 [Cinara cedri]|uniref:F-box domain-containing protein n=1 Tax=Cinara cedri TaxID=506608 RepID=A0A5E4N5H3_9HEMI|nr:Hypothetical protein CINCED_3A000081 [Cinara cedri]
MECNMPPEVITQILQFVSFEDRKRARSVNSVWYYASIHPMFIKNELFIVQDPKQNGYNDKEQMEFLNLYHQILKESKRKMLNLKLRGFSTLYKCSFIFEGIGEKVREIYLENILVMTNALIDIITSCSNIKKLEFSNINRWSLAVENPKPILSLKVLVYKLATLPNNVFNLLASIASNIDTLDLDYNVLENEVYTPYCNVNQTNVMQFIKNIKNLTNLRINDNWWILNRLPKNLQLKALNINYQRFYMNTIELSQFEAVIRNHKSLQQLEILGIPCCLILGIRNLQFLQELNLTYAKYHVHVCCNKQLCFQNFQNSFNNMKYLKILSVTAEVPMHKPKYFNSIPPIPQHIMKSIQSLDCYFSPEMSIATFDNNLTSLRIRNGNILSVEDFIILFKELTKLTSLWIDRCYKLNDDVISDCSISNLKGLTTLKLDGGRQTYRCLHNIKFSNLITLYIHIAPVGLSILGHLPAIEKSFKTLASSNPVLSHLTVFCVNSECRILDKNILLSYFKCLKYFKM